MKKFFPIFLMLVTFNSFAGTIDSSLEPSLSLRDEMSSEAKILETQDTLSITIFGSQIKSLSQIHSIFKNALKLNDTYGGNLDALFDVLTDKSVVDKKIEITVVSAVPLLIQLGIDDHDRFLETLNDAAEINKQITIFYFQ